MKLDASRDIKLTHEEMAYMGTLEMGWMSKQGNRRIGHMGYAAHT
jgi:hypothetical protein